MKKVVIAAQERIDDFEHTAIEFFRAVLGMDYGECIVTDESRLSDFASCGLPEDIADTTHLRVHPRPMSSTWRPCARSEGRFALSGR